LIDKDSDSPTDESKFVYQVVFYEYDQ